MKVCDDVDAPEISQWHMGRAGEYAGTMQKAFDIKRYFTVSRAYAGQRVI